MPDDGETFCKHENQNFPDSEFEDGGELGKIHVTDPSFLHNDKGTRVEKHDGKYVDVSEPVFLPDFDRSKPE